MLSVWYNLSCDVIGFGKKSGRIIFEFKWNFDTTFGKKVTLGVNQIAWGKKTKNGGLTSRAAISPTLRAGVIASKNKIFQDNNLMSQVAAGSKGGLVKQRKTNCRSQGWACLGPTVSKNVHLERRSEKNWWDWRGASFGHANRGRACP